MTDTTKRLVTFTALLWVGLAIGAYFRVPSMIQQYSTRSAVIQAPEEGCTEVLVYSEPPPADAPTCR